MKYKSAYPSQILSIIGKDTENRCYNLLKLRLKVVKPCKLGVNNNLVMRRGTTFHILDYEIPGVTSY